MKKNWVVDEARKADGSRGYVVLEDPDSKKQIEYLLVNRFWPFICSRLRDTGYSFDKKRPPTEFEINHIHERSLSFMLFDNKNLFFRGNLKLSRESWMVESEFFLSLKEKTDHRVIFELLGNSRLCGMPPELSVHKGETHYFQIRFRNGQGAGGAGAGWVMGNEESVRQRIDKVIRTNVEMYEVSKNGFISPKGFARFLSTAYEIYEAY